MLTLEQISQTFQQGDSRIFALKSVSLQVKAGEFVALTGPSGSGKSTLLNIAGLTESPSEGRVLIEQTAVNFSDQAQLRTYRRTCIGYVFQYFNLLPDLTALENVMLCLMLNDVSRADARLRSAEILEQRGLGERLHHFPRQLSAGQLQRIAVCRALVHRPKIILADEPTGNLDTQNGQGVLSQLREAASQGAAVLMVTHSDMAVDYTDRQLHLRDGSLQ